MIGRFFLLFLCFGVLVLTPMGLMSLPGSLSNGRILWMNPLSGLLALAAYFCFLAWFFLSTPALFMTFGPVGHTAVSADALGSRVGVLFAASKEKGITVSRGEGDIIITVVSGIKDFQGVQAGEIRETIAYHLRLDGDRHMALLESRLGRSEASAGLSGLYFALFRSRGMYMENSWTWKPSIKVADGRPHLTVQQMKIDTGDVLNPLLETVRASGWSMRYGLFVPRWLKGSALVLATFCLAGSIFLGVAR